MIPEKKNSSIYSDELIICKKLPPKWESIFPFSEDEQEEVEDYGDNGNMRTR